MCYKRPALMTLGYEMITNELYDIGTACDEVSYYANDSDTLLNALDGDDEAEYEFRMAFSDLSAKIESLNDALRDSCVQEYFDDCTVGLIGNRYTTIGYDSVQEDYFGLTRFEQELAYTESGKKLTRRTKQEMISIIGQCLGIVMAFLDIRHSYDYLKATMDILRDENTSLLQIIKDIETQYKAAEERDFSPYTDETRRFDALLSRLPERAWIE
jgi:hypothetical protein